MDMSKQEKKLLPQALCPPELRQEVCGGLIDKSKGSTFETSLLVLEHQWCYQGGMGWLYRARGIASSINPPPPTPTYLSNKP